MSNCYIYAPSNYSKSVNFLFVKDGYSWTRTYRDSAYTYYTFNGTTATVVRGQYRAQTSNINNRAASASVTFFLSSTVMFLLIGSAAL